MQKLGSSYASKIDSPDDLAGLLDAMGVDRSKPIVVKPNWVGAKRGEYTDAKILDWLFQNITGAKTIVESYTFWRTDKYTEKGEDYFSVSEATLEKGKDHWDHFRKQDEWFLGYTGIGDVLEKYSVDYVNVTNEYWAGVVSPSADVRAVVEKEYGELSNKNFYGFVPRKLWDMRGVQLISFAHAKAYENWVVTLSTKNLFGLLPAPSRWPLYHGGNDELLAQSVIDINKVYRSLFECSFLVEGVFTALKEYHKPAHEIVDNWGVAVGGKNSVEVDAVMASLMGKDLKTATVDVVGAAAKVFGGADPAALERPPKELMIP